MNSFVLKIKIGCLLIALFFTFNCNRSSQETQISLTNKPQQFFKLNSGRQIKTNRIGKMDFPYGQSSVYVLEYETEVGVKDIEALRSEIEEIWQTIQMDAEKSGLEDVAIYVPNHEWQGPVRTCHGISFFYSKEDAEEWRFIKEAVDDCIVTKGR